MGLRNFYGKERNPLLWAGSWAARGKITVRSMPKGLSYCKIFMIYTELTNVAAGRQLETHDLSTCKELHAMS